MCSLQGSDFGFPSLWVRFLLIFFLWVWGFCSFVSIRVVCLFKIN